MLMMPMGQDPPESLFFTKCWLFVYNLFRKKSLADKLRKRVQESKINDANILIRLFKIHSDFESSYGKNSCSISLSSDNLSTLLERYNLSTLYGLVHKKTFEETTPVYLLTDDQINMIQTFFEKEKVQIIITKHYVVLDWHEKS